MEAEDNCTTAATTTQAISRNKGKLRASSQDASETTPLLDSTERIHDGDEEAFLLRTLSSRSRNRSRLFVLLSTVFLSTLFLCLIAAVAIAVLTYSYQSRIAGVPFNEILGRSLVLRGPERVNVLNATEGSLWLNVDVRLGIDAGEALEVILDSGNEENESDFFGTMRMMRALGRYVVRQMGQVTASSAGGVRVYSASGNLLANVSMPSVTLDLMLEHPKDESWLTELSLPVQVNMTRDIKDLNAFLEESWRDGSINVLAQVQNILVNGGSSGERTWKGWFKFDQTHLFLPFRQKIPEVPGFPVPGKGHPFPQFSDIVTLKSFVVASRNDSIAIEASATLIDPFPDTLDMTVPSLPFVILLKDNNTTEAPAVPLAEGYSSPFSLTHPNITVNLNGAIPPLPLNASRYLSSLLSDFLSGIDSPIFIGSPLLPSVQIPALFPAPHPKPRVIRNVTIENMHISFNGDDIVTSGTIHSRVVLPDGLNIALDLQRIWPDVLIFDGEAPSNDDDEGTDFVTSGTATTTIDRASSASFPSFTWPPWKSHYEPIPKEPLPSPLPERAFARIRPNDWLDAISTPIVIPDNGSSIIAGTQYTVTAEVKNVPLEVLPGRDGEFRSFVAKVLFKGKEGVLAGLQGKTAVAVVVDGMPVREEPPEEGGEKEEEKKRVLEFNGLPLSGSFRVGRKSAF